MSAHSISGLQISGLRVAGLRVAGLRVIAIALVALLTGCPDPADAGNEGDTRPFAKEGRAGILVSEGTETYLDGEWRRHGAFIFRDDTGEIIARGRFTRGLEDGPWEQTFSDGAKGRGSFTKGQRSGEWITFHRNGSQQDKGQYVEGLRVGTWTAFRADETLLRIADYKTGQLDGQVVWYREDGKTIDASRSGTYRGGERRGPLSGTPPRASR